MQELTKKIQETAAKLLIDGKVDMLIGFEKGTLPLRSTPCFVRDPAEAKKLIWNTSCENNLANYLRKRSEKVGVIAKGCDVRSIVGLLKENQIEREKLLIIGIPCRGIIDRRKVEAFLNGEELIEAIEDKETVILKGLSGERSIAVAELLHDSCSACRYGTPVLYDILLGEPVPEKSEDTFEDVLAHKSKSTDERSAYFAAEVSKCIRCYACRNACPMCYCEECFVDCSTPQWIGKGIDPSDILIFHAVRAFHLAGRCVDCGACDRACPMGVNVRKLSRKVAKDVKELFGYEAGVKLEEPPPLCTFKADDPQTFLVRE